MKTITRLKKAGKFSRLLQVPQVPVDTRTAALVGFALRARQVELGFEAVRRAAIRGKLAGVLVSGNISRHSLEKIIRITLRWEIPLFQTAGAFNWEEAWGLSLHKILGLRKSELGRTVIQNFKAGA